MTTKFVNVLELSVTLETDMTEYLSGSAVAQAEEEIANLLGIDKDRVKAVTVDEDLKQIHFEIESDKFADEDFSDLDAIQSTLDQFKDTVKAALDDGTLLIGPNCSSYILKPSIYGVDPVDGEETIKPPPPDEASEPTLPSEVTVITSEPSEEPEESLPNSIIDEEETDPLEDSNDVDDDVNNSDPDPVESEPNDDPDDNNDEPDSDPNEDPDDDDPVTDDDDDDPNTDDDDDDPNTDDDDDPNTDDDDDSNTDDDDDPNTDDDDDPNTDDDDDPNLGTFEGKDIVFIFIAILALYGAVTLSIMGIVLVSRHVIRWNRRIENEITEDLISSRTLPTFENFESGRSGRRPLKNRSSREFISQRNNY